MANIRGAYPGGPGRRDDESQPPQVPIEHGEQVEQRRMQEAQSHRSRKRRRRAAALIGGAIVLAGGIGVWLGIRSRQTAEEIATEEERQSQEEALETLIREERERVLNELWRMEGAERAPRPPQP